jgi:hypothetical protein
MSLLEEISATLTAAGIRHALIGALALAAYGVNRASVDLDLFVADASCLRPGVWADLQSRGIAVDVRKGDMTDPLAGVVRFQAPGESPIDIVVGKWTWQTRILERAEPIGEILVVRAWSSSSSTPEVPRTPGMCSSSLRGPSEVIWCWRSSRASQTFPRTARISGRRSCKADPRARDLLRARKPWA